MWTTRTFTWKGKNIHWEFLLWLSWITAPTCFSSCVWLKCTAVSFCNESQGAAVGSEEEPVTNMMTALITVPLLHETSSSNSGFPALLMKEEQREFAQTEVKRNGLRLSWTGLYGQLCWRLSAVLQVDLWTFVPGWVNNQPLLLPVTSDLWLLLLFPPHFFPFTFTFLFQARMLNNCDIATPVCWNCFWFHSLVSLHPRLSDRRHAEQESFKWNNASSGDVNVLSSL